MEEKEIKSLIEESNLDINIKNILEHTLCELAKENKKVFNNIKDRVFQSNIKTKDTYWQVCTMLVPMEKEEDYKNDLKFYPMCKINEKDSLNLQGESTLYYYKNAFLNCSYNRVQEILGKTYIGKVKAENGDVKEIKYNLILDRSFIEKEKIIYEVSEQYNINLPKIFSPYSRKFVAIYLDLSNLEKEYSYSNIDLCLDENNLKKYIIFNKTLLWNIFIEDGEYLTPISEEINKGILPYEDEVNYIYTFNYDKKNEYVLIEDDFYQIDKKEKFIKIKSKNDIHNNYKKIVVNKVEKDIIKNISTEYFSNEYKETFYEKKILRTKADVNYVVNRFENVFNFHIECVDFNEEKYKVLKRYSKDFRYYKLKNELVKFNNKTKCYLKFSGDINSIYFEDYVNYVLSNLDDLYPEFIWVGVYE